ATASPLSRLQRCAMSQRAAKVGDALRWDESLAEAKIRLAPPMGRRTVASAALAHLRDEGADAGISTIHLFGRRGKRALLRILEVVWDGHSQMFDAILRIYALTVKELLAVLKEPRSRFTIFIPPIIQCVIYGYVATYDLTDVPYAVYDRDRSQASH